MLRYFRLRQSLSSISLCLWLTAVLITACQPSSSESDRPFVSSESTTETPVPTDTTLAESTETPDDTSSLNSTDPTEGISKEPKGASQEAGAELSDESEPNENLSPEETGIAELEKVVDAIASKNDQIVNDQAGNEQTDDQAEIWGATVPAEGTALALSLSGLQAIDIQTGSIRNLEFGGESDLTHQVVTKAFGEPTQTVEAGECPAGPMTVTTWANGLSINTADQQFVGWLVRPEADSKELATIAGVGIGTSLGDMQKAYTVEVFDSSLGVEFNVGQMSGLLSDNAPGGIVTNLWAGINCIFR